MATVGYQIPIHNALTTPLLLAGVPRKFAILNGTFCAAFVLGLHTWFALPVFIITHMVAVLLTKRDPFFFSILVRHLRQKPYYQV